MIKIKAVFEISSNIAQSYYYSILQLSNVTGLSEKFVETISKVKLRKET